MKTFMMTAILLAVAAPAIAQQRPADPAFPIATSQIEAERTMQLYSDCMVGRRQYQAQIAEFLRTSPESSQFGERGGKLVEPTCMPRSVARAQMRMAPAIFRPALYSALYRAEFKRAPADVSNRVRLDYAAELEPGAAVPANYAYLREVGDCTSRAKPAEVRALLLTRIGGDDEKRALAALMPAVQQCVPEGAELRFSRTILRGTLAEGLYKLSKAPMAAPVSSTN